MARKTPSDAAAKDSNTRRPEPSEASGRSKRERPEPGLYLVATPIGNLRDITLRALDLLAAVDLLACEDTRVTRKLLTAHGIARPVTAYHEHNAERVRPRLLRALAEGRSVALVADAGTPLISDPGFKLVRAAREAGYRVTPVPGPSAVLAALSASGLPCDRFFFAGFLPAKAAARRTALAELAPVPASLLFFEAPRRLAASLADMAAVLGDRETAIARELTKRFEELRRGRLAELAEAYAKAAPPRGEIAIVVAAAETADAPSPEALDAQLRSALAAASLRDAVALVTAATGLPRRQVYARALELAAGGGPQRP